jgi:hypothetical protein
MDPVIAERILRERRKREQHASLLDTLYPKQRAFVEDPAHFKALFGDRRAGKSQAVGYYLFHTALTHPGTTSLYLGLFRHSVRGIMNKDIFQQINQRYQLGAKWHDTFGEWQFPNGSIVRLRGADANSQSIHSLVGQKYQLVILDEASKYRHDLNELVGLMVPAMGDNLGTIVLSGTPSNIVKSLFYDVTSGTKATAWAVHKLTWRENTARAKDFKKMHDTYLLANPGYEETPQYKQEWLGQWVIETGALVYRYNPDKNLIEELPKPKGEYTYVLAIDLGFRDQTSLAVVAYHPNDPCLYVLRIIAESGLLPSEVAHRVRALWKAPHLNCNGPYPFVRMVCDTGGLGLAIVEEMKQRYQLPLEPAEKIGKKGVIDVFNADMMTSRIRLLPEAREVIDQWETLIWDERKRAHNPPQFVEDPKMPNDMADSILYAWRACRNYHVLPNPEPELDPRSEAGSRALFFKQFQLQNSKPDGWIDEYFSNYNVDGNR